MTNTQNLLNRRELVGLGISAGFALAISPVTGLAITTPDEGLETELVKIPSGGKDLPAYVARPKGKGSFPVVLVIHEIFGVHAYIQDVCRRLAKLGYYAIAPSLFFRAGDVTQMKDIDQIVKDVVSKTPQSQVLADLDSALAWAKGQKFADSSRVAITGFCWGGNVSWMYPSHNPSLKAAVAWYGRLVNPKPETPDPFPVDIAEGLKVPVLGLYGGKDKGISQENVEKMRAALKKGKSGSDIVVYPEAEHGFHADYRPSYHQKSAEDGWKKMTAWLKQHGV